MVTDPSLLPQPKTLQDRITQPKSAAKDKKPVVPVKKTCGGGRSGAGRTKKTAEAW
jgi:hypothetical protein